MTSGSTPSIRRKNLQSRAVRRSTYRQVTVFIVKYLLAPMLRYTVRNALRHELHYEWSHSPNAI